MKIWEKRRIYLTFNPSSLAAFDVPLLLQTDVNFLPNDVSIK